MKTISSLLITAGAEINALNNLNETPLDKARKTEIKEWLQSLGGKYNAKKDQVEGGGDDNKEQDIDGIGDNNKDDKLSEIDKQYLHRIQLKREVVEWLNMLSFHEYIDNFIQNGYDRFDAIYKMEKEDLKDIGVKMGHIKVILQAIETEKKRNEPGMNDNNN